MATLISGIIGAGIYAIGFTILVRITLVDAVVAGVFGIVRAWIHIVADLVIVCIRAGITFVIRIIRATIHSITDPVPIAI